MPILLAALLSLSRIASQNMEASVDLFEVAGRWGIKYYSDWPYLYSELKYVYAIGAVL